MSLNISTLNKIKKSELKMTKFNLNEMITCQIALCGIMA